MVELRVVYDSGFDKVDRAIKEGYVFKAVCFDEMLRFCTLVNSGKESYFYSFGKNMSDAVSRLGRSFGGNMNDNASPKRGWGYFENSIDEALMRSGGELRLVARLNDKNKVEMNFENLFKEVENEPVESDDFSCGYRQLHENFFIMANLSCYFKNVEILKGNSPSRGFSILQEIPYR